MATTKEYKDFILEQLNVLDGITCKSMYFVDDVDNNDILKDIIIDTCNSLQGK